jgi:hypothetical protein
MVAELYLSFFTLLFLLLLRELKSISVNQFFFVTIIILMGLIVFKDGSILPDYQMYKYSYESSIKGFFIPTMEISFFLISILLSTITGSLGFYFLLGLYGIIPLYIFQKLVKATTYPELSTLLFFSNFFIIFLLIQIRGGVSLFFIYLALLNRNNFKLFIIYFFTAFFFHYSAIFFFPLLFIDKFKLTKKKIIIFIVSAFLIKNLIINGLGFLIDLLPNSYITTKLLTYTLAERVSKFPINLFGFFILSKLFLLFIFISKLNLFNKKKHLETYLKLYVLGVFIYISFSGFPEIAVRISNILFVSEVFLIPYLIKFFKQQKFIKTLVIFFSFIMFYVNLNYTSYFNYTTPI